MQFGERSQPAVNESELRIEARSPRNAWICNGNRKIVFRESRAATNRNHVGRSSYLPERIFGQLFSGHRAELAGSARGNALGNSPIQSQRCSSGTW